MKNKVFIAFLIFSFQLSAQLAIGDWRMFVSPNKAEAVASNNTTVLTGYENGVMEYDAASGEKSIWTKVNGLSDIVVSSIYWHAPSNSFYIAYINGNLDKWSDGKVTNMPDILLANVIGSKKINHVTGDDQFIYVSTDFAIVKFSTQNLEVKDSYYIPGNKCAGIAFKNDSIFALSPTRLYKAKKASIQLVNPATWNVVVGLPTPIAGSYKRLQIFNNKILVSKNLDVYQKDTVYLVNSTSSIPVFSDFEIVNMKILNNRLILCLYGGINVFDDSFNLTAYFGPIYSVPDYFPFYSDVAIIGDNFYVSEQSYGLIEHNQFGNKRIGFEGPIANQFYAGKSANGITVFAGGGRQEQEADYNRNGSYILDGEKWSNVNETEQPLIANSFDFVSAAINPKNSSQIALGSYSTIPLAILNNSKVTKVFTTDNSILDEFNANLAYISDLNYDSEGNLWIMNSLTAQPIYMLDPAGVLHKMNTGNQLFGKTITKFVINKKGVLFIAVYGLGIVAFYDNKTPDNPADDQFKIINDALGTGKLPSILVNSLVLDKDNELWIGSAAGICVIYNTDNIFEATSGNYEAQTFVVTVDGVNEIFLGNNNVLDIEVDGANRKWLSIFSAGVFLLNPAGNQIIQTFTTKNSPLLSDNVRDIVINPIDGETFFITDKGMISYRSDASEGDEKYSDVVVFPNPVKPEHTGPVTIQGIAEDSDVKVTDASGNLVFKTTSNGGTAVWDGKTLDGKRVASGVYFFWTAKNKEKKKFLGKVVFIN